MFSESYTNVGWNKGTGPDALKTAAATREVLDLLEGQHPDADTELHYKNAFQLLVATILSAQSTDQGVNMVTPALFARYRDAQGAGECDAGRARAADPLDGLFPAEIQGAHRHGQRARASSTAGRCRPTWMRSSRCPASAARQRTSSWATRWACRGCPSIGTCSAWPIGSASPSRTTPVVVEQQLCGALPPERWTRTSDTLILHGRRICNPKPLCDRCAVTAICDFFLDPDNPSGPRAAARLAKKKTAKATPRGSTRVRRPRR